MVRCACSFAMAVQAAALGYAHRSCPTLTALEHLKKPDVQRSGCRKSLRGLWLGSPAARPVTSPWPATVSGDPGGRPPRPGRILYIHPSDFLTKNPLGTLVSWVTSLVMSGKNLGHFWPERPFELDTWDVSELVCGTEGCLEGLGVGKQHPLVGDGRVMAISGQDYPARWAVLPIPPLPLEWPLVQLLFGVSWLWAYWLELPGGVVLVGRVCRLSEGVRHTESPVVACDLNRLLPLGPGCGADFGVPVWRVLLRPMYCPCLG